VYVTEDRKVEGFFETMSIAENIQVGELTTGENPLELVTHDAGAPDGRPNGRSAWGPRDCPRSPGHRTLRRKPAKVVIAKSLIQKPKLVIFDEPTRGVDVGAIVEIHRSSTNSLTTESRSS